MLRAIWGRVRRKVGDVARRYNPIQGIYGASIGGNFIPLRDGLIDPGFISRSERAARRLAGPRGPNQTTAAAASGPGWEQLTFNFDPPPPAPSTPIGRGARQTHFNFGDGTAPRRASSGSARTTSRSIQGSSRPTNETAAAVEAAATGAGRQGRDFFSALEDDYRAFRNIGRNYRSYRNANMGRGRAAWNSMADFFTAVDLPEADRFAAYWRRGLAAGGIGLIGIGVGTRALDAAFNRSRYY